MGFYEEISNYYDLIFPVGKEQVNFITEVAGKPPKALLDIACGTGGYSLELAKRGYQVTATDLDAEMIDRLRNKIKTTNLDLDVIQGNMLDLRQRLDSSYDTAFCIGNSLVHLDGEEEIQKFFLEMKNLLTDEGSLIIQIINYDRILTKNVRSLPTIENKETGLTFQRIYRYDKETNKIFFKTILEVADNKIDNEIPLYPLLADKMVDLLRQAGFNRIKLFGDFKGSEFDKNNSYALVVAAS